MSAAPAITGPAGDAAFFDVEFALDRINARMTWTLSRQHMVAFRAAIAAGDLGPARIVSIEQQALSLVSRAA